MLNLDPNKPTEQVFANNMIKRFDSSHFQRLLVEWIVDANLPFNTIDNARLRDIFDYLNPSIAIRDACPGRLKLKELVVTEYYKHREVVLEALQNAPGRIHIAFDGWRAPNRRNLYGIAAFFRDEHTNRPRKIILDVPEVVGRHFGSTIAGYITRSIDAYGIGDKLGYFTLDNAANNDTAMDEIGNYFGFNGRQRRCRCFGHCLNISAKALLFGRDVEAFEAELNSIETLSEAEFHAWRKRGPVGKLHNLVVTIHRTDYLTDLLLSLQADEERAVLVVLDNDTRWLSQYYMIKRALRLRHWIEMVVIRYRQMWENGNRSKRTGQVLASARLPLILQDENQLTENDWTVLGHFSDLLQHYENTLKQLEGDGQIRERLRGFTGSYGNIWQVVQAYEYLLHHLETYKVMADDFPDPTQFKIGVNMAWTKLDAYYNTLDETPVYYAALALHPAYRWDWFESRWEHRTDWVTAARSMVDEIWRTEYRSREITADAVISYSASTAPQKHYGNAFEQFCEEARSKSKRPYCDSADEYVLWMAQREEGNEAVDDPIAYWHDRRNKYPRLSMMALDIFTVQSMSAECERLFSVARNMVTQLRNRLDVVIVAICMVLRSWYRSGLVADINPLFLSVLEDDERQRLASMAGTEAVEQVTSWLNNDDAAEPT
jgi:hypothetical protein